MSRPLPERRGMVSQLFRALSWHGAGVTALGAVCTGYAMTAMALTGAAQSIALGAIAPESIQHIEFVLWFAGALLLLAGVAAASVKIFVIPAVEKQFAEHMRDPDAHAIYLKMTDYTKRHDDLMESVNQVGLQVASLGGQLRQDIRTDRKADAKAEGEAH